MEERNSYIPGYQHFSLSRFLDCMIFNAVFNAISMISRRPMHIHMFPFSSFNQYYAQYPFQATDRFPVVEQWTAHFLLFI